MIQIFKCRIVLFSLGVLLSLHLPAQDTTQYRVKGRTNLPSQYQKPYMILVSADGFRYDFAEKYNAAFLQQMSAGGVKATSMKPSYPSLTFPNHYSIATGLYPAHHGLVDNNMYDRKMNQFYSIRNRKAVTDPAWY
ncbi:MAG TPA: alkaline phosphatase family protein, partial [Niabella sp.]|nr:alkaline phosphatase family protein [Niabella sp.]